MSSSTLGYRRLAIILSSWSSCSWLGASHGSGTIKTSLEGAQELTARLATASASILPALLGLRDLLGLGSTFLTTGCLLCASPPDAGPERHASENDHHERDGARDRPFPRHCRLGSLRAFPKESARNEINLPMNGTRSETKTLRIEAAKTMPEATQKGTPSVLTR